MFAAPFGKSGPKVGVVAQLVEQRTENPCVDGSIPFNTTSKAQMKVWAFFVIGGIF